MLPSPQALVTAGRRQYGRFDARPLTVNPLDQWSGPARRLKRLRLKEWIYFTLVHPELFSAMAIQDANYVSSSEIYAWRRTDGKLHQHARTGVGGTLQMPQRLYPSRVRFAARNYELFYEFGTERGEHRIGIHIGADRHGTGLDASLVLHGERASAPLSLSSRIPGGVMFTHKRAFPVSGSYRIGDTELVFKADRDLALLDEHKTFLPYRTRWTWGTFATIADGTILGANLIERQETPGEQQEGCIWIGQALHPLNDISFARSGATWQAVSADGQLQLSFVPDGTKHVKHQLLIAAIDYEQIFGRYSGSVCGREIADVPGVVERMHARL
jgi:Protein of unknown function (DUF2804)